jgi:hypothetical protein
LYTDRPEVLLDPANKLDWLPALLASLPLALFVTGREPGYMDAYEALAALGSSTVLHEWLTENMITDGRCEALIHGATPLERGIALATWTEHVARIYLRPEWPADFDPGDGVMRAPNWLSFHDEIHAAVQAIAATAKGIL